MLYFIGFMGVGKTTIGKQFSLQKNINFIDTDKEIETITNKKISDIFNKEGENYFREQETITLKTISKNSVVACGGGLPAYNNNMYYIKKSGISIYLQASKEQIFNRLSKSLINRPLIKNKSENNLKEFIKKTLIVREKFYLMADYIIDTNNMSEKDVLRKINTLSISI